MTALYTPVLVGLYAYSDQNDLGSDGNQIHNYSSSNLFFA